MYWRGTGRERDLASGINAGDSQSIMYVRLTPAFMPEDFDRGIAPVPLQKAKSAKRAKGLRSPRKHKANPDDVELKLRREPVAVGAANVVRFIVPRTAAQQPIRLFIA